MKKLEEAKVFDCPVKFTITDCDAGWVDMNCNFNGNKLYFRISELGDLPTALTEIAFMLHSEYDNQSALLRNIKLDEEVFDVADQGGNNGWFTNLGGTFQWDEEPRLDNWHIYYNEEDFGKDDYDLTIEIERLNGEDEDKYKFVVPYREYCYAVAKCFTDALKKFGFNSYDKGSYTDHINVRHLLIVKAYALGILGTYIGFEGDGINCDRYNLTFEEELKLLAMDM